MSEIRVTTLKDTSGGNSSTTADIFSGRAKAWVNFNGSSTVAIRAQFNVNTITDNGTGDYTVNFSSALADANYSVVASHEEVNATAYGWAGPTSTGLATSSCRINTPNAGGNGNDRSVICVAVFR